MIRRRDTNVHALMPKDFAGRGRAAPKKRKKSRSAKRVSPKQRVLFHGPSFASGALVGAAIVVLAAYGPELIQTPDTTAASPVQPTETAPKLEFEFPDLLRKTEVTPDPEPYAVPVPEEGEIAATFNIQAASFQALADADALRAELLLANLPVRTSASDVNGQRWYRVVVGPFAKRVEADRAMTRLRERGLGAIWINIHN